MSSPIRAEKRSRSKANSPSAAASRCSRTLRSLKNDERVALVILSEAKDLTVDARITHCTLCDQSPSERSSHPFGMTDSQRDHFAQHRETVVNYADLASFGVIPTHRNFAEPQSAAVGEKKKFD